MSRKKQKLPMRRQDRQKVKAWLRSMQPHAENEFTIRRSRQRDSELARNQFDSLGTFNRFPAGERAIRSYFAWCRRHLLEPTERTSLCLYWGVSEPLAFAGASSKPRFSNWSVAALEELLGCPIAWLSDNLRFGRQVELPDIHDRTIKDHWDVVAEWFTQDEDEKAKFRGISYDRLGCSVSRSPGRFLKTQVRISLESSLFASYDRDRVSAMVHPTFRFTPEVQWSSSVDAETTLSPRGSVQTLHRIFDEISHMMLGRERPQRNTYVQIQSYVSSRAWRREREWRQDSRWRRRQRRAGAREATNDSI